MRPLVEQHGTLTQQVNFFNCFSALAARHNRYVYTEEIVSLSRAALDRSIESNNPANISWSAFTHGMTQLWYGNHELAEELFHEALALSEFSGDVVHQARCLTYLTILYRKLGTADRVRTFAMKSLEAASRASLPEYTGIGKANLAWVAWSEANWFDVSACGQQALEAWSTLEAGHASLALRWLALFPLMQIALVREQLDDAVGYARAILEPSQQQPKDTVATAITIAIQAWADGDAVTTRLELNRALENSGDRPPVDGSTSWHAFE